MSICKKYPKIDFNFKKLKLLLNEYKCFAKYTAPQNLLNSVSQNSPVLILGVFYGEVIAGAYFFAIRIVQLPVSLINSSIKKYI